eukprot:s1885_g5.t1
MGFLFRLQGSKPSRPFMYHQQAAHDPHETLRWLPCDRQARVSFFKGRAFCSGGTVLFSTLPSWLAFFGRMELGAAARRCELFLFVDYVPSKTV